MTLALDYIWMLPVAIGIAGVFYFAMKDLAPKASTAHPKAKTKE